MSHASGSIAMNHARECRVSPMKILFCLLAALAASMAPLLTAADDASLSRRFYAGDILRAEVQPDNPSSPVLIKNENPYKPASRITTEVGFALLTVRLDPGRSIGIYDYSLFDGRTVFPCVALMDDKGEFDASLWEIKDTKPNNKYSMLFKVQIPVRGSPQYALQFNLLQSKWQDINLPFVNVRSSPFTSVKDIPEVGMLGVDPYRPQPGIGDAAAPAVAPAAPQQEKKPELSDKERKRRADLAAWEAMDDKGADTKKDGMEKPKKNIWDDLDKL